jgi:hypothetical protein
MRPCTLTAEDGRMLGLLEDDGRIEDRPLHMKEVKGNNGIKLNRNDVAIFVLVHVIIMYHFPRDCGRASSWRQDGVPSYWTMIGNPTTENKKARHAERRLVTTVKSFSAFPLAVF